MEINKEYSNGKVTVVWKPRQCIHSGICAQGMGDVFKPKEKPWIKIDAASSEEIITQVKACPSGALSYYINSEKNIEQKQQEMETTKIQVIPNGPVKVTGHCEVTLANGETETKENAVFLCRCGQSSNRPYCDGTHKADFKVD